MADYTPYSKSSSRTASIAALWSSSSGKTAKKSSGSTRQSAQVSGQTTPTFGSAQATTDFLKVKSLSENLINIPTTGKNSDISFARKEMYFSRYYLEKKSSILGTTAGWVDGRLS